MYFHPLWNPKFFIFKNKVLLIHLLLVWTLLRLLQTLHRIILNPFYPTNLSLITSPKQILIANLAYILLLTKQTRKSMNSTGVTKTTSLLTVFQVFPFMNWPLPPMSMIPLLRLIFWLTHIPLNQFVLLISQWLISYYSTCNNIDYDNSNDLNAAFPLPR